MRRFLFRQLRSRPSRTATLGAGMLVAAASFVLLTSAVSTGALQVRGTVAKNWKTAYDILVRPNGSYTQLEREQGLVADNYLSGIFGGITMKQWRDVLQIPGVDVAAPIANIGYVLLGTDVGVPLTSYVSDDPIQLFRVRSTWVAQDGLSAYPDVATSYLYYTRSGRFTADSNGNILEEVPGSSGGLGVCDGIYPTNGSVPRSPFDPVVGLSCYSARTPGINTANGGGTGDSVFATGEVGTPAFLRFPILLSAIDPVQESRLVGLDSAVVSGRFLAPGDRMAVQSCPDSKLKAVPVIASTKTFLGEQLDASVERLSIPSNLDVPDVLASQGARRFLRGLPGETAGTQTIQLDAGYSRLLDHLSGRCVFPPYESYRTVSPVRYRIKGEDRIVPVTVTNDESVWTSSLYGSFLPAPVENQDVQFRHLKAFVGSNAVTRGVFDTPSLQVVGRFDPEMLPGFSELTRVPLETYLPPELQPGNARSSKAMNGEPLLPTQNLGDYVAQPPLMLTTLQAAKVFSDPKVFQGSNPKAPISVIRIRVAGVTGPDPVSRERIRRVAQAIVDATGLSVDITAGSSPHPLLVDLPPGKFGRPPLTVQEGWTKKGASVAIIEALDRKSLALFALILVVCGLFTANGALAAIRSRRREIGTLLLLGWGRGSIFRAVLGELLLVGLLAGAAGTGIAAALVGILHLKVSLARTLLVAPVAVGLALLAGAVPAWGAARSVPLDAVRLPVMEPRQGRPRRRLIGMAAANLTRLPGRTLLGAGALLVGVAALAFLVAVNLAFRGTVVGTLLGNVVSVQVRAVDWLSVALAIGLGALSVADVVVLNLKERAPELVTLKTTGWTQGHLGRLIAYEGLGIGVLGSVVGALLGLALAAQVGGMGPKVVLAALVAAVVGVAAAALASSVPALLVGRMTPPEVLAEE
jgi:putative ABC transport system permease protein